MSKIIIQCIDQVLFPVSTPEIASGGVNENTVEFSFCNQWDGFGKVAVFYQDKKNVYYSSIDENNTCVVPKEATQKHGNMFLGVFGVKDDVTRTSNIIRYSIKLGAITDGIQPSDPTPDIYEQIIGEFGRLKGEHTEIFNLFKNYKSPLQIKESDGTKKQLNLCFNVTDVVLSSKTITVSPNMGIKLV